MNPLKLDFVNIPPLFSNMSEQFQEDTTDSKLFFELSENKHPLDVVSMKFSYRKAFTAGGRNIDDQVLTQMIKMTNGYAYGFQLLGYLVWETNAKNITTQTLADVTQEYQEMLYRNVYTKIYQSLSPMDRRFVQVMAEYSEIEVPVKFIGEKLNKPKNYLSNYRRRLLDDQVIMTKERGKLNFTLPFFKDFILEYGDLY